MTRIVFLNRVYWPSTEATAQLLRDVSVAIAQSGTKVVVVTGTKIDDTCDDQIPNLAVVRVGSNSARKLGVFAKLLSHSEFNRLAQDVIKAQVKSGDIVVAMTDPPMLGVKIGKIVREKKAEIWHWSQDVYPEVALAVQPFGRLSFLLKLLENTRNREWEDSTGLVAIGEDMADLMRSKGIERSKIQVCPNWAPDALSFGNLEAQRKKWNVPPRAFVVAYSGNLGRAHVLTPVIDLAEKLETSSEVRTLIIGQGAQRKRMQNRASEKKLSRCSFLEPAPRADLGQSLAAVDVHLITMRSDCVGAVWPSKFYGIVAAARPIVFVGPCHSEISNLITKHRLGISIRPSEIDTAEKFIVDLKTDRQSYEDYCSRVARFHSNLPGLKGATAFWNRIVASRDSPPSGPREDLV
ncbi:MAG: glycosyltransferase family 4 protein [Synoicihabitans sp.]